MSNHLISLAYKRNLGTHTRKAVMVLLADKASDDGSGIWASKQRMADELCMSKQTILNTMKGFIEEGLIQEVGNKKCTNGYTVEYAIDVEKLASVPLVKWHADQSTALTGQGDLPVNPVDGTSQTGGPDQSTTLTQTLQNPPEPPIDSSSGDERFLPDHVFDFWNEIAPGMEKQCIRSRTPERRVLVKARMAHHDLSDFREAFDNFKRSDFLRGAKGCQFDWFMQKKNFLKVLEGNYNG